LTSEQLRIDEWATLTLTGGSKGQTALGDAHPYLALFEYLKTKLRFFSSRRQICVKICRAALFPWM